MATPIHLSTKSAIPAQARTKAARRGSLLLVYLFFLALILPTEASLFLGPLRLSPYRVVLILAIVPCLFRLLTGAAGKITAPDVLILLHVLWAAMALINAHGIEESWEFAGIYAIETVMPYLIARCYIRSAEDFVKAIRIHFVIVVALIPFAFYESVTGHHLVREAARAAFGGPPLPVIDPRLGLDRAFGPFEHSILYGVFAASVLATAFYTLGRRRSMMGAVRRGGLVALATFFSLSAGPLVAFVAQAGFIAWDRLTQRIRNRWTALGGLFVAAWTTVSLLSTRSPIIVFIWYFTFNVHTAYNRVLIWEYGTGEVMRHPIFGIGLSEWERADWMTASIDNFWLAEAVRYGLPALAFLVAAILLILIRLGSLKHLDRQMLDYRTGLLITIIGLCVAGATVHFWNAVFCLFMFLLGSGMWLLNEKTLQSSASPREGGTKPSEPSDSKS